MVKILMIIAPNNFRDEEYFEPKNVFIENKFQVLTASKEVSVALGKLGGTANVDLDISEINSSDYDGVVFVGGNGAIEYQRDETINKIIHDFLKENKLVSAICIAPTVLAYAGALKDKNATVWNGDSEQSVILGINGANFVDENVVVDENIITANGPHAAKEFAKKIVEYFED